MSHEEIQDRLEAYVDDRLEREERREVDRHLADCAECRSILDDVAPVDLSGLGPKTFDDAAMRRTVRRSIFRTAVNAALLLLAGFIAIWFLSALVVQPLLVDRGHRAAEAVQASIDLGAMTNPGAMLTEGRIESGWLDRELELRFSLPVGAGLEPMLETTTSIGLLGLMDQMTHSTTLGDRGFQGDVLEQLRNLGDGTVSTVAVRFQTPLPIDTTQSLADDPGADVRVVWAGFDASLGRDVPPAWTGAGALGYGACQEDRSFDEDLLSATSAGFSQGSRFRDASIKRAHRQVVSALENITSSAELEDFVASPYGEDPDEIGEVLEELRTSPRVSIIVVTGPSTEVASFVASHDHFDTYASLLAVDFYNWTQGICGR